MERLAGKGIATFSTQHSNLWNDICSFSSYSVFTRTCKYKRSRTSTGCLSNQDFYVDDLITGSHSINNCQEIQRKVTMILQSAGMTLRKCCTNSPKLVAEIANADNDPHVMLELKDNDTTKTLGLVWNPRDDQLLLKIT